MIHVTNSRHLWEGMSSSRPNPMQCKTCLACMTVTWCMQGTFLPAAAADLDRMRRHTELLEAGQEKIRQETAGLRS